MGKACKYCTFLCLFQQKRETYDSSTKKREGKINFSTALFPLIKVLEYPLSLFLSSQSGINIFAQKRKQLFMAKASFATTVSVISSQMAISHIKIYFNVYFLVLLSLKGYFA